jgi:hypothetical protein
MDLELQQRIADLIGYGAAALAAGVVLMGGYIAWKFVREYLGDSVGVGGWGEREDESSTPAEFGPSDWADPTAGNNLPEEPTAWGTSDRTYADDGSDYWEGYSAEDDARDRKAVGLD